MPVTEEVYKDKRLFPFFEGLIPEGWLLDIASENWKINSNLVLDILLLPSIHSTSSGISGSVNVGT